MKSKQKVSEFLTEMPSDPYGKRFEIGRFAFTKKFGVGRVIGLAFGADGSLCLVCSFHRRMCEKGQYPSRWKTWLVRVTEAVALDEDIQQEKPGKENE